MYVDDKFGPLLCLHVFNLNAYFGLAIVDFLDALQIYYIY